MKHPYATETYARALSHWGEALYVPAWNTYVVKRKVEVDCYDASGTYPITIWEKTADIEEGLDFLRKQGFVTVVLVLDDFHRPSLDILQRCFNVVHPFKTHYIYCPQKGLLSYDKHHRYELRQALKMVRTDALDMQKHMEEWAGLYHTLVLRHGLKGLHDFPLSHYKALTSLDNVVAFGAWQEDELVSCHIWVYCDGYAHSHLAASNDKGYKSRAAYAVNDAAIRYFSDANVLNFGGGAGNQYGACDGLAKFKKGFSNHLANAYLCGAVFDSERYKTLLKNRGLTALQTNFFPAYRATM